MASAKFLEEALSTDVDESAVSAIVGSLENQLVTSSPHVTNQTDAPVVINQNHINSAISNGGTVVQQKHGTIANGDPIGVVSADKVTNSMILGTQAQASVNANYHTIDSANKTNEGVKIVYSQGNQTMATTGPIMNSRVTLPTQSLPNGTLGISPHQVLQTTTSNVVQNKPTLVIKTSGAPAGTPGLVTVPLTTSVPAANNQLTLQTLHGLQPGQQGHLLLKTENGQYQLLRVGPAPAAANIAGTTTTGGQPVTFRMQTVAAATTSSSTTPAQAGPTTVITTHQTGPNVVQTVQKPASDNTKEKCRKFLANLLELSSREPKAVERNVRTLIQELIDMKVEPEDFCDKLERLLNASPQPCLIGFLKKSLPLLRQSLATKELTIDGIRPPPANVVFSIQNATQTVQAQIRPGMAPSQVRIVAPGTTVVRPNQVIQPRLVTPIRGQVQGTRMVTTIRQPSATNNVIVSNSQPPALHPVYPTGQVRPVMGLRQPLQVRGAAPGQSIRQPIQVRTATPQAKSGMGMAKTTISNVSRPGGAAKTDRGEKKSFSAASTYAGDDDINDVAAMGGVNLAEETQKILGSTEFVGTQIRSCKEEVMCSMGTLQHKIRQIMMKHGLEEPGSDVAACISHAAHERLKNLIEKLAIITEHRIEVMKSDNRYEIVGDVKGQLKFLEDLDKAERKRHEDLEREILLRAAKSRSKSEDPEQAKLKAKAKEMQRVEMEELRQREANATALKAIGPRKKPRLEGDGHTSAQANSSGSGTYRGQPLRQRMKKVTIRDVQFLFESEKDLCKSKLLFKSYLK